MKLIAFQKLKHKLNCSAKIVRYFLNNLLVSLIYSQNIVIDIICFINNILCWSDVLIVTANILILLNGIHLGWTSPSLRKILSEDYPLQVSEEEGSFIAIISFLGDIIGGIYGCSLINIIGRKNTLLSITIPYVISFGMIAISNHGTVYLYIARVLGEVLIVFNLFQWLTTVLSNFSKHMYFFRISIYILRKAFNLVLDNED